MFVQLKRIYVYISSKRKVQFALLIFFAIVTSLLEVISLGAVMPLIGVLTQPEELFYSENLQWLILFFNIETPQKLIFPITLVFGIAALISGIFRTLLLRFGIIPYWFLDLITMTSSIEIADCMSIPVE